MFDVIAEKIVKAQLKYPKYFLIAFGIIILLLVPGIFNLVGNIEPSLEKLLPQDIQEVKTMNDMRTQFGADMIYLLVYAEDSLSDIRNPQLFTYVDLLAEKIRTRNGLWRSFILEIQLSIRLSFREWSHSFSKDGLRSKDFQNSCLGRLA